MCRCAKLNGSNVRSAAVRSIDVGLFIHERVDLGGIGKLQFEEPAIAQWIRIDDRWIRHDRLVGLDDLAADRSVNVGRGLDGFHHCGRRAFFETFAGCRQLDKNQVAELLLGVLRDADDRHVAVNAKPLVIGRESQHVAITPDGRACSDAE
jgi:hypothetical protein